MKNTGIYMYVCVCLGEGGNPHVLMGRLAILNLETGPSFACGAATRHASLVKTKDIWNNQHCTGILWVSGVASEPPRSNKSKQWRVNTVCAL